LRAIERVEHVDDGRELRDAILAVDPRVEVDVHHAHASGLGLDRRHLRNPAPRLEAKMMVFERKDADVANRSAAQDGEPLRLLVAEAIGGRVRRVVAQPLTQRRDERGAVDAVPADFLKQHDIRLSTVHPACQRVFDARLSRHVQTDDGDAGLRGR
jgi:hypothetical protein